eukprot:evm.model.scf_710.2 EVM.evm.TU.scf_710.2   scf_710:14725-17695(-)
MAAMGGQSPAQGKEVVFDLDAEAFSSDHFRMHEFKVKRCPRARPHDWTQCPFAHPGEKARRRDPRRYRYSGTACPEFRKSGCCRRGDACPFAHGVFECWLHPSRYRTQLCTDGGSCKRRVCFFAHSESELRRPEDDPVVAQSQVQAELAAEVQSLQQQHLTQALSALLGANSQDAQGGAGGLAGSQLNLLTLELLKQANPSAGSPQSASAEYSSTGLQLALLQQLAVVEQMQKQQQQQREQAQQMLNGYGGQCSGSQEADVKGLQALLAAVSQNSLQQALKSQLAEQVPASSPAQEALSALTMPAVPASPSPVQMPASAPMPTLGGSLGGYGVGSQAQEGASGISAAMEANGTVGGYNVQTGVTAGVTIDPNGAVQMNGFLQTNGMLAPGQLAALRARAAILTGGRRSIDNGVLARSMNELVGALDPAGIGAGQQMAALGGEAPLMYSAPLATAPGIDALTALQDKEALKQAKSLLENLHMLQGGKSSTSGPGLMQGVNMETLLAANGLSAVSQATSFDK